MTGKKKDYNEVLTQVEELCKILKKIPTHKELIQNKIISDSKGITKFIKQKGYKNLEDYLRKVGYMNNHNVVINGISKACKDLNLDEIIVLFNEYKFKYGEYPTSSICNDKNKRKDVNLPNWSVVKKILNRSSWTVNDFYMKLGKLKGLKADKKKYNEYVKTFIEISDNIKSPLKWRDLTTNEWGLPAARWFIDNCPKKINTYNEFLEYCGFKSSFHISKEKAIELVLKMQEKLKRPLMYDDFRNPEEEDIGITTINNIWGSMNKMKEELGLEIIQEDMIKKQKSEKEMLEDMQNLINKLGRLPTADEVDNESNILGQGVYFHKFGGINNTFLKLGYLPTKKTISIYLTNEEIKELYKAFIDDLGFTPSYDFCKTIYKLPSPRTVLRRLECSWNDFIELLGYKPNDQTTIATICYAKDNSQCLSTGECVIHNYLLNKNVENLQKEVFYKDIIDNRTVHEECGMKRCDWIFTYKNKLYIIEYFGMMQRENYRLNHDAKLNIIKNAGLQDYFISIYPNQLNKLDKIFYKAFI